MTSIDYNVETTLPFTHGIEVELQLIRKDGSWIRGEEIVEIFDKLISKAKLLLDQRIRSTKLESIRNKCQHTSQTEEGERGSRITISYENQGTYSEYTLIGHDPNVTSLTWILEIATPPCNTLEELAWWIQTLVSISQEALPKDERVILISTGLNPTQEYVKNLSFGEHHHILGPDVDSKVRIAVYNMLRNFIPHLIALSVNSPFENKAPTDHVTLDENGHLRAPRCKRSIRLLKNITQMGPTSQFEFIPYMVNTDKVFFSKHVNRSYARMVDIYPFTDYGTIEIRIFDTQLSIPRRIGLALLIQAIALKAKRMIESGMTIPNIEAESLAQNRESALSAGLWGAFRASKLSEGELANKYNYKINDDGSISELKNRYLSDAIVSMLNIIREEIEELNLIENPFMQPVLTSIFGSEFVEEKTTGADIQLKIFAESDQNMVVLLRSLYDMTRECCTNWLYDPLGGMPNLPTWLSWWKGLATEIIPERDIVFAGQKAEFSLVLQNISGRTISDLIVSYIIENSNRIQVQNDVYTLNELEQGEIEEIRVSFPTERSETAYNILAAVSIAGKEITLSETIRTYWIKADIRSASTTQFADGYSPLLYTGEIETNYPTLNEVSATISVITPNTTENLAQVSNEVPIESGDLSIFNQSDFPPLVIPLRKTQGVLRCHLRIILEDKSGQMISNVASKPFYVGFTQTGPSLALDIEIPKRKIPGESIFGFLTITKSELIDFNNAKIVIYFRQENSNKFDIAELDLIDSTILEFGFQWNIPYLNEEIEGVIVAELYENNRLTSSSESEFIRIDTRPVVLRIESMRTSKVLDRGDDINGWLRIRRSTEDSGDAYIKLYLIQQDEKKISLTEQKLKASRDLSVSFGPFQVPDLPKSDSYFKLQARLIYEGRNVDEKTVDISLREGDSGIPLEIDVLGVDKFVNPDDSIDAIIQIQNTGLERIECELAVHFDTRVERFTLHNRKVVLESMEQKFIPVQFRVPLSVEMSSAYLRINATNEGRTIRKTYRMKVKAIERPRFWVETILRDRKGERITGFIQRITMIDIETSLKSDLSDLKDYEISIRILTRRNVIKDFTYPIDMNERGEMSITSQWTTPPIEMITGYFLDIKILHLGHSLPNRAVVYEPTKLTVY